MAQFSFKILKRDRNSRARLGIIKTAHGEIETPYLVPVATYGSVRALDSQDLYNLSAQCTLVNTYHLHFRPGDELIKKFGGIHSFMKFNKPIFSDSAGFQAFSLGSGLEDNIGKIGFFPGMQKIERQKQNKKYIIVKENGIQVTSIYDGSKEFMTPKDSMKYQSNLGTDIIMALDECTSPLDDYEYTKKAVERTHRWALESLKYHDKKQALYGIIQGGFFKELRLASTKFIRSLPFDGIAIGGSLGPNSSSAYEILDWITPELDDRPIHLLGIGVIDNIFESVSRGIDTFDCVAPTRVARHGHLYISPESGGSSKNKFRIDVGNESFKNDSSSIDPHCNCQICKQGYSRAYLSHLYKVSTAKVLKREDVDKDLTYYRLASIHNLHFMLALMNQIRESIKDNSFLELKKHWLGK